MHLNKLYYLVIFMILLVSNVSALNLNNTVLHSYGLDTNITISRQWNLTSATVDSDYIYITNLTSSNDLEVSNEELSFNLTETNAEYTGTQVPYFSTSTDHDKIITSAITQSMSGETIIDVPHCSIDQVVYTPATSAAEIKTSSDWTCGAKKLHLPLNNIDTGQNTLSFDYNVSMTNCTNGTIALEWTVYDEDSVTDALVHTAEVEGSYWYNPDYPNNFSNLFTGSTTYMICIDPAYITVNGDFYIKYTVPSGFTHRFYLNNHTFTNSTTNRSIYNFNTTSSISDLKITARKASDYSYYSDVYITLERRYPSELLWRAVQMHKTGDFGLGVFNIKEENTDYRLVFRDYQGNIMKLTETMTFDCDINNVCDLTVLLDPYTPTTTPTGLTINYAYDPATKVITLVWNDGTGETSQVVFNVRKETMAGTTDICSATYYASSNTVTCNATAYSGEVFVYIEADDTVYYSEWLDLDQTELGDLIDTNEAVLWTVGIMLVIIMFGVFSPVGAVIAAVLGLIIIGFLGILTAVNFTFIIVIAVIAAIISSKLRS